MTTQPIHSTNIQASTGVPIIPMTAQQTLRVLHVVNGEYYAGAERVQDLLALHLPEFGCEVGFACVKADQFPSKRQCSEAPLAKTSMSHPWNRQGVRDIVDLVNDGNYDLIHSHTPRSAWAAVRAAQLVDCPIVHTMHDVSLGQKCNAARKTLNRFTISRLRNVDVVTTVSPVSQSLAERLRLGKRSQMILNGVPAARSDFQRTRPSDTWTLGTVGLIRPCKGIEVLIRAIATLRSRQCPARASVVGTFYTPEYEREVMALVDELGVGDLIDFVGFSSDVPSHLEKFDLFVMPSVGPEGLPMVLLEAMAHSLPTIGSAVAGVGDVVVSGEEGFLFPAGDDEKLANAVQQFTSGQANWKAMSEKAKVRHENEFSARRMASEFVEIYRSVM